MYKLIAQPLFSFLLILTCVSSLYAAKEKQRECDTLSYATLDSERNELPPELRNLPYAIYPTSPEYNTARLNFNKRFVYFPKAIITPRTDGEAEFVLSIIKRDHLRFAVRSGRHCMEPGSLSSDIIFDLSNFIDIVPDISREEVYVGAGNTNGTVIPALGEIGYVIPTGTCPSVGIPGLTMGGGIGLLNRQVGLTCDAVKSIKLLTANAGIIDVSESNYPDLFWALRGGGNGSYGIVLGFTYKMTKISEATFYELLWEFDPDLIPPIIRAWQPWVKTLPDTISTVLGIRHPDIMTANPENTPPLTIRIFGLKIGPEPFTEWEKAFKHIKPQPIVFIRHGTYLEMSQFWAFESPLPFNKLKSRILMEPMKGKTIREITKLFRRLEKQNPNYLVYFNLEAFGGAMAKNPQTAFFPRKAFGWWEQAYFWPHQSQSGKIIDLSRRFYAKIPAQVSKYCYSNMVDYDLGSHYLKRYYGTHVDRLIRVKDAWDPTNLFHWKQSIPTDCR